MQKYEEIGVAGEGAYGVVLKCKEKDTGEIVAVKRFRDPEDADEEGKRIMQREIKILRALKHDNIVQVKESFRQQGVLHIVFEFLEKCVLELLEENSNGLGNDRTRILTFQLVSALEHCHRNSIIHRDIKPDNLLVNLNDNSLRLCDFGSACMLSRDGGALTDYVATRWYRAPELLVSFNNYDASVDMWGVGCVTVELLTSKPLFAGQTDLDQLSIIQRCCGPLTASQNARCFELSNPDFGKLKVPPDAERQTLQKRFGSSMTPEQLQLLDAVIKVDPAQRATAKACLGLAWFKGVQAPQRRSVPGLPPAGVSPRTSQQGQARPASVQKPRVRRDASPYTAVRAVNGSVVSASSSTPAKSTPRGPGTRSTVSGVSSAGGVLSEALEVEESLSFAVNSCAQHASVEQSPPEEIPEDSIDEDIMDGTIAAPPTFAESEERSEQQVPVLEASTGSKGIGIALAGVGSSRVVSKSTTAEAANAAPSPPAASPPSPRGEALDSVASLPDFSLSPEQQYGSTRYTDTCEDSIMEEIGDDTMPCSPPFSSRQRSNGTHAKSSRATSPASSVGVSAIPRLTGGSQSKCSSLVRRPASGKPPTSSLTPMA
eukprot:TRINITY_DN20240_c0_g1_i1.p1 TRINITY_DN20240_c0_g1~~TRINITY_DN20240_c0_g1_i1.p1  ORF type:complete len:601 (+),score=91.51 TRINITY_DN20240_c0_g1_i1:86-1888(+)